MVVGLLGWMSLCAVLASCGSFGAAAPQASGVQASQRKPDVEHPLVDVHFHSFNAHYLPVREIMLGKRDAISPKEPPADWLARLVARIVLWMTPWPGSKSEVQSDESLDELLRRLAAEEGHTVQELEEEPMVVALREFEQARSQEGLEFQVTQFSTVAWSGWERLARLFGAETTKGVPNFFFTLTGRDDQVLPRYLEQLGDAGDGLKLVVSHMMDLSPVYDQAPKDGTLLSFDEQVVRMNGLQGMLAEAGGPAMIYFVAYCPFREYWPKPGSPGDALSKVRWALEKQGAYGVKLYPPSGYRPSEGMIPDRPESRREAPKRQWAARYEPLEGDAEVLDALLDRLLIYCEENGVPVFAHSNTREFEARKGYGRLMAHPRYWKTWLEQRSKQLGRKSTLRLCFAHAGGSAFWFSDPDEEGDEDWGQLVYDMCVTYPNVYCEIGVHDEVADPAKRRSFQDKLVRLFEDSGDGGELAFSRKIMYGTDYYMPIEVPVAEYYAGYVSVFEDERLNGHANRFFWQNAIDYLNVDARLESGVTSLPAPVRARLSELSE